MARRSRLTISQALTLYELDRRGVLVAYDRVRRAARRIRRAMGKVDAADQAAVARAVKRYIEKRKAAPATIRRELSVLSASVRHAARIGRLSAPTFITLPPTTPARQRWLTPDEARMLTHHAEPEIDLFLALALHTGARLGAILDLTWSRVDFAERSIDFRADPLADLFAHRRKSRAVVPMALPLLKALRTAAKGARATDRVIKLSATAIGRRVRAAGERAGLADVTPHVMRHTVATWLLGERSDISLIRASRLLGHRSVAVTEQVYAHLITRHLRETADAVASILEGDLLQ